MPLSPTLQAMFAELRSQRGIWRDVFVRDGQPITKDSLIHHFEQSCKRAQITGFRFHDFRHTAVTNMRRAGVDPLTSMQITGHKTMICFTRYNSFREADLRAAAAKSNTYLTLAHSKASEQAVTREAPKAVTA